LAPPGTGKTVAFIVPSAVTMDNSCQLLNDQKPELFHMTSGHRATLGPVFQLMWSAQDLPDGGYVTEEQAELLSPDLIELGPDGEPERDQSGAIKIGPVYYPSWNPIGPSSIPSPGPKRDLYIERLVSVLCPDPQGGGDKFWTSRARAAMIGLIHYLVVKVEMGQDERFPDIDKTGIPADWHGKEPCFPLLVDWFTEAQNSVDDGDEDPMRSVFKAAVADAKRIDEIYSARFSNRIMMRAIVELTGLMNQPDKTRGSILTTLDEAMSPFKNEAVRQRTSQSSFSFNELRGSPTPEARAREAEKVRLARMKGEVHHPRYARDEWKPITIYISINAEDAKAFATITGIFVDSANAYLVANGPNAIDDRGNQLGPHDFFFLLDEAPTLPKLDTVVNGPAVGRSKKVSYAIVGQDFAQIESRYSKSDVETLKSTTAIKIILSQNNESAAKSISSMAGSMTYMKASYSTKTPDDPISKFFSAKKEVIGSQNWDKRAFLDESFVMSMPTGKHLVLVQNFMNRPILAETPRFFLEPDIAARVYNLRTGSGPRPALPMPQVLMKKSAEAAATEEVRRSEAATVKEALADPDIAIIVTPQNIADVSRDPNSNENVHPVGTDFAFTRLTLTEDDEYFAIPADDEITVTSDIERIHAAISGRRVYVFSDADAETLNTLFRENDLLPVAKALFQEMLIPSLDIEEEETGDIFTIGYYGAAHNTRPADAKLITPTFALKWMCDIVVVVRGCQFELSRVTAA
jgi:type IV secretion system protein VirD4